MDRAYQSQLDPGSNIDDANVAGDFIFFARNCMGEHITENIWRRLFWSDGSYLSTRFLNTNTAHAHK